MQIYSIHFCEKVIKDIFNKIKTLKELPDAYHFVLSSFIFFRNANAISMHEESRFPCQNYFYHKIRSVIVTYTKLKCYSRKMRPP